MLLLWIVRAYPRTLESFDLQRLYSTLLLPQSPLNNRQYPLASWFGRALNFHCTIVDMIVYHTTILECPIQVLTLYREHTGLRQPSASLVHPSFYSKSVL